MWRELTDKIRIEPLDVRADGDDVVHGGFLSFSVRFDAGETQMHDTAIYPIADYVCVTGMNGLPFEQSLCLFGTA